MRPPILRHQLQLRPQRAVAAVFATSWRRSEEGDVFQHPARTLRTGTTHAQACNIVLKYAERNRTQSICAGLIASTIVTADCADDACICATSIDATCPGATLPGADTRQLLAAELPVEGTVLYSLDPVITSLPYAPAIAVANLPADLELADAFVDRVSQADAWVNEGDDEDSPRLTRARRRSSSNQNSARHDQDMVRAQLPSMPGENDSAATELAAFDLELQLPKAAKQPAPKRSEPERSLMQDAYIAFGVNGR